MAVYQFHRQSHYIEEATLDPLDEPGSPPLNGVASGLVHRFACLHILADLAFAQGAEAHQGLGGIDHGLLAGPKTDATPDGVLPAGKQPEHLFRVSEAGRFSEHHVAEYDLRIGRQHDLAGCAGHRERLLTSEPANISGRSLAGFAHLSDSGGSDDELEACILEKLLPPGGLGCEYDHDLSEI